MIGFGYDPDILTRFPRVCGGVLLALEVHNAPTPPDLQEAYLWEQHAVQDRIGDTPLSEVETLSAWRGAFRAFGVDPTKYRSAAEALLRRLTKKGDIPCINMIVDICNLVSIRYALPVAAFDTRLLRGVVRVRFAGGSEWFLPHDKEVAEHPDPGEVIFHDEAGLVVARRWCWKQSHESVVMEGTRRAIVTVEAQHPGAQGLIEGALHDLEDLFGRYLNCTCQHGVLGVGHPEIRSE